MAITVETRTDIVELIVGMVGAAPGATILSELADIVDGGLSLNDLAIALANNPAFKVLYPSFLTTTEFATNFLTNLMGSQVDATTLSTSVDAMVADLNSGTHRGAAMYTAIKTLGDTAETDTNFGNAAAALNNKTEVAVHYSVTTQQSADTLDELKAVVTNVTNTQASVDAAKAVVDGTDNAGQTYTLTSTADNLKGTGGNDTFVAVIDGTTATNTTLSAADTVNGSDGMDTFNITLQGGATATIPAVTTSSVENVVVRNVSAGATALTASGFSGATGFTNNLSTGAVTFTGTGASAITVVGNDIVTNGATTFTPGSLAVTVNIQGGVGAGAINGTEASALLPVTSAIINTSGGTATTTTAANQIGALTLGGTSLDKVTINAGSSFTAASIAGWDTTGTDANKGAVVITGAHTVNVGTLNAAVESVDASASTGSARFTASTQTDFTFKGGAGDDRVTTAAVLGTTGSIDAGAGTADRLTVAASAHLTATTGKQYSGFEVLSVASGQTASVSHLAANNTIGSIIVAPAAATTVNGLNATTAGAITVAGGGAQLILGVTGASTVGQIDTVKLTSSSSTTTRDIKNVSLAGVEKLETTNITITALTSATALDSIVIKGGAAQSITSGAIVTNVNTVIDGSAATGALTLDFSGITTTDGNPMLIKGGSGADTITTTGDTDDLANGGLGIDQITVTKASGTKWADVQSDALVSTDADLILGFVTAENDFDYNGALSNGSGVGGGIAGSEIVSAASIAAALATGDAGNDIVFISTATVGGAAGGTQIDAAVTGGMTAVEADAIETALTGTGGALNGAIANLDSVLGASDAVLFQLESATNTVLLRVTNTDTAATNTLTAAEIEVVAVFNIATLAAGDII